jgi:hypothetical protein
MEVLSHTDVAGHQLLIDLMGVDEKYTQKFAPSYKIMSRLIEVLLEGEVMGSSMYEGEDHFMGFCYSKFTYTVVSGYQDRNLITVDIRCPESVSLKEVSDWLIHEYRPLQCVITEFRRGSSSSSAETHSKKVRSTIN